MFLTLIYVLCGLSVIETAKILGVFPTPSISHQVVFRVLTEELVNRGHEVIVITADPAFSKGQTPANLTEIDVHDISYDYIHDILSKENPLIDLKKPTEWIKLIKDFRHVYKVMEVQLNSEPQIQELIKSNKKFDLIMTEAFMIPAIAFSHIFKAPLIQVSSFGPVLENLETVGASTHPVLYPIMFRQRLYNLSLYEKIKEYYYHLQYLYYNNQNKGIVDEMLQRMFGSDIPSVNDLADNVDMLFLNIHPIWMDNQPMPQNVVFMGGLHQRPQKELPQDLKLYLDSSKNGVVYVSFGTNVRPFMFSSERLKLLTETFSELPYDVLFKWNDDELPGKSDNIKLSKWLPQSDLLRHPKVKAFVMQGGLQSTDEAITAGVPLICIPMLGDQWYNAEKYVKLKIGHNLNLFTLTKSQLKHAIETVIDDKSYRENIVKLRERMNDQPQTSLERAVWWAEYVIRHRGARHLRSPAANISWAQYYELQMVAVLLTALIVALILISYLFMLLQRFIVQFASSSVKIKIS